MSIRKILTYYFFLILFILAFYNFFLEQVFTELLPYGSYISFFCDISIILLGLISLMHGGTKYVKDVKIIFLIFLFISTITFIINVSDVNLIQHLNGLREYLVVFCSFFFFNYMLQSKNASKFNSKFIRFLIFLLIIQVPITIIQFLEFGAGDKVGGSFGLSGGSGILSTLIYLGCFLILTHFSIISKKDHFNSKINFFFLLLFIPSFLNETKVSFLLIPLFFLCQLRISGKQAITSISIVIILLFTLYAFNEIYSLTTGIGENPLAEIFNREFLRRYLGYESLYAGDIARITKIEYAISTLSKNPESLLFGLGLGLFRGGSILEQSSVTMEYFWLLSGTRPYIFTLLLQIGVIGSILVLYVFFNYLIKTIRYKKYLDQPFPLKRLFLFLTLVLIILLVYNDSLRGSFFSIIVIYVSVYYLNYKNIYFLNKTN